MTGTHDFVGARMSVQCRHSEELRALNRADLRARATALAREDAHEQRKLTAACALIVWTSVRLAHGGLFVETRGDACVGGWLTELNVVKCVRQHCVHACDASQTPHSCTCRRYTILPHLHGTRARTWCARSTRAVWTLVRGAQCRAELYHLRFTHFERASCIPLHAHNIFTYITVWDTTQSDETRIVLCTLHVPLQRSACVVLPAYVHPPRACCAPRCARTRRTRAAPRLQR